MTPPPAWADDAVVAREGVAEGAVGLGAAVGAVDRDDGEGVELPGGLYDGGGRYDGVDCAAAVCPAPSSVRPSKIKRDPRTFIIRRFLSPLDGRHFAGGPPR